MKYKVILPVLLAFALFYRHYGLENNYSFWTDEGHVAIFSRAILETGRPVLGNGLSTGWYQWLLYWIGAGSAKIFGLNEFALRLPSVIFGTLTVLAVYWLGRALFSTSEESKPTSEVMRVVEKSRLAYEVKEEVVEKSKFTPEGTRVVGETKSTFEVKGVLVPLLAAFLTAFLKIEILWSRQVRPYQALQFFYLLSAYFIYKLTRERNFNRRYFLGFFLSGILASLMHGLGLMIFLDATLYLLVFRFSWLKKQIINEKKLLFLRLVISFSTLLFFAYFFRRSIIFTISQLGEINNLFYYRVFIFHNYLLLVFFAFIGFLFQVFQKKEGWQIPFLFLVSHFFVASFLKSQPFVRYFYIVFPFIILLSCYGVNGLTSCALRVITRNREIKKLENWEIIGFLACSIILIGHLYTKGKLVLRPQAVYSLNEDMQEIPEVDWKKIYGFVGKKLEENKEAVLMTNWNDLPVWYLGEGRLDYIVRKDWNFKNKEDPISGAKIINSLDEFKEVIEKEKAGYFVLDSWDSAVPEGVREYCHQNLKRELEIDRLYPVQPRYWTVWIYSWGEAPTIE